MTEELAHLEYLRTKCQMKQAASGHDDDHPYAAARDDGEILSYKDYLKAVAEQEKHWQDITPPAALRLARKRLAALAKQAESE